jgi:hypothetical protein
MKIKLSTSNDNTIPPEFNSIKLGGNKLLSATLEEESEEVNEHIIAKYRVPDELIELASLSKYVKAVSKVYPKSYGITLSVERVSPWVYTISFNTGKEL